MNGTTENLHQFENHNSSSASMDTSARQSEGSKLYTLADPKLSKETMLKDKKNNVLNNKDVVFFIFQKERSYCNNGDFSDMWEQVIKILCKINSKIFEEYKKYITEISMLNQIKEGPFKNSFHLVKNIYICRKINHTYKMETLRHLFDLYHIDYKELSFYVKEKPQISK